VIRLRDGKAVRTSYDDMIEDLAWHGIGPLAHEHGPRRSLFAKSHAVPDSYGFDDLVDELTEYLRRGRARRAAAEADQRRRREHERTVAKAYRDLDLMVKALPSPPIDTAAKREAERGAEVIRKSFTALASDRTLNADQRGRLMLALSAGADRVEATFKSHPTVVKIDAALRLLERAKQRHLGAETDRLVNSLIEAIRRGEVHDNLALEERLREIKRQLTKENENAED
jgi:hypothetical protein